MRIRKTLWHNDSEPIIVIMAILLVLGTINVFSSSFVLATHDYQTPFFFLKKHLAVLALGIVAFILCRRLNYEHWRRWMLPMLLGVLIMLVCVLAFGRTVNGAQRWLYIGPVSIQPAEFAKLISLMLAAAYLAACVHRKRKASFLSLQIFCILLMAALVYKEPDMGTACVVAGVPLVMFMLVGVDKLSRVLLCLLPVGVVAMILGSPYRLERMKVFFDPWSDPQHVGYQTVQSLATIGSGGFFGMGFGAGVSKYQYLPEAHTDFAFAIFCQEHGFAGACFVFLLYTLLLVYCIRVANRAQDTFGQILATGIMILIVGQGIVNMLMVSGTLPVIGVPLPFISYGGSSLLVSMMAMGMLTNIADHGRKHTFEKPAQKPEPEKPAPRRTRLHVVPGGQAGER
ncbi:MAG: putative lipid II flippase FtsW [Selenomonas sp.]|nr:putative lipid II flippase FtsW [Selenomonas sp.]